MRQCEHGYHIHSCIDCPKVADLNMNISFHLNGKDLQIDVAPNQTLLSVLRANGVFGPKHGCETGECGACAVLIDDVPMNSCVMLAVHADGRRIETIEGLGGEQQRRWPVGRAA